MKGTKMDINAKLPEGVDLTPEQAQQLNELQNKARKATGKAKAFVKKYGFELVTGGLVVGGALVAWKFRPNLSPAELKEWYEGVDPESLVNFAVKADTLKVIRDCQGYVKLDSEAGLWALSPLDKDGRALYAQW